jgi:tetratricopeptide (TPR) repeat protein
MDAMPVIVSFVAHPRRTVRKAARGAVDAYGRNIIWQLRRAFRIEAGRDAELGWSTARTRRELYRVVDRERLAPARSALNRGLAAFEVDDLDAMEKHFERALAAAPGWSRRLEMAPGFAALGRMQLDEERWDAARRSLGRALALDPAAKAAAEWRALRTFAESEAALAEGRIDLEGYRRVLETVPAHSVAAARIDVWSGARAARARERRRLAGGAGALLFGVAGVSLLWRRRAGRSRLAERRQPDGDEPAAAMPSDSGERGRRPALGAPGAAAPDAHLGAPDTLPG